MNETTYSTVKITVAIKNYTDTYLKSYITYQELYQAPTITGALNKLSFKEIDELLHIMQTSPISIKPEDSESYQNMSLEDFLVIMNESGATVISPEFLNIAIQTHQKALTLVEENNTDVSSIITKAKAEISKTKTINPIAWDALESDIKDKFEVKFKDEPIENLEKKNEYTELKVQQMVSFFEKSLRL